MSESKQTRSIWENIKIIVQGVADALGYATDAVSTTAQTVDEIAKTGHVMAKNNREIVEIESEGKKQFRLAELTKDYPDLFEMPPAADKEQVAV